MDELRRTDLISSVCLVIGNWPWGAKPPVGSRDKALCGGSGDETPKAKDIVLFNHLFFRVLRAYFIVFYCGTK